MSTNIRDFFLRTRNNEWEGPYNQVELNERCDEIRAGGYRSAIFVEKRDSEKGDDQ